MDLPALEFRIPASGGTATWSRRGCHPDLPGGLPL